MGGKYAHWAVSLPLAMLFAWGGWSKRKRAALEGE